MPSPKIHILGLGNLGRLFAHALASKPNPPSITLLFHRPNLLQEWEEAGQKIHITTQGQTSSSGSFEVEEVFDVNKLNSEKIDNLIVTTKTINTAKAINAVKSRLGKGSTILFAQNGMGTIEEVTRSLFSNEEEQPSFLAAITSHGVYSQGPFRSVHAGLANVTIGPVNTRGEKSQYLVDQVVGSPVLAATEVTSEELLKLQLEKLVVNAMMNPLTVLFECKNGELFNRAPILGLMRLLLAEASEVLRSLPESSNDMERFSTKTLEERVLSVAEKTAQNTSSMLQDVQAGRETEIEYINGWIVRKGNENGVSCEWNTKVVKMVKEGKKVTVEGIEEYFPV